MQLTCDVIGQPVEGFGQQRGGLLVQRRGSGRHRLAALGRVGARPPGGRSLNGPLGVFLVAVARQLEVGRA